MNLAQPVLTGLLILARVSGVFLGCPLLNHQQIPKMVRAGLVVALSLLLHGLVTPARSLPGHWASLLLVGLRELLLGFLISWLACLSLQVISSVGGLVDLQSGLSNASVLDPTRGEPNSLFSILFNALASLVFLQAQGLTCLIILLAQSFQHIPLAEPWNASLTALNAVTLGRWIWIHCVQLALPWMLSMWAIDVVAGIWSRFLPQLNLLSAGPPLKVLLCLWLTLHYFYHWLHQFQGLHFQLVRGVF